MDTDFLSNETYNGVLMEAEKFNHDLTLQFAVLASDCEDEKEYLEEASLLISDLRTFDEDELYDAFFGILPDLNALRLTLNRIEANIKEVRKIPIEQRHFEF